ncbi:MAG: tRNA lysidine(34) synthetase TilS [Chloroflexi bacterium]|nr:tRNA lysidine(34) synthetase TilS [Chloroflexota bacterium]
MSSKPRPSQFVRSVRQGLRSCRIDFGAPLVAAVSGGPDSMAMALALLEVRQADGLEFVVAHFNHGRRGVESDLDQSFVEEWCSAQRVSCVTGAPDQASLERVRALSPEAAARELRYEFLTLVARDARAQAVATAHTLDDQAETILLHTVRGAGLVGALGMAERSTLRFGPARQEVVVVRPLLKLRRADTRSFCESRGVNPRIDLSNQDVSVPRNRLRLEVFPLLERINPGASDAVSRFGYLARAYVELADAEADRAWAGLVQAQARDAVSLSRTGLTKLAPVVQSHALSRAFRYVAHAGESLESDHVEQMIALISGRAGTSLDLPGGVRMKVGYRSVTISSAASAETAERCPYPPYVRVTEFEPPARLPLGRGIELSARIAALRAVRPTANGPDVALLDADAVGKRLRLRPRARGDRFQPLGAPVPKKLQDFFVDTKVPREWRDRVPIIEAGGGIAWIAGYRIAEWAKVRPGKTRRVLRLELLRKP